MRINHNIASLNTNRVLGQNNKSTSKSLEKLSSGLAINGAADNAAGLAISEKMRNQVRGLNQATTNANDGISLIQTAEGGLNEVHNMLDRMKELAVQSANDTNSDEDRAQLQKEMSTLREEITRISKQTQFNGRNLLDGSLIAKYDVKYSPIEAFDYGPTIANMSGLDMDETYTGTATVIHKGDMELSEVGTKVNTASFNGSHEMAHNLAEGTYRVQVENADDFDLKADFVLYKKNGDTWEKLIPVVGQTGYDHGSAASTTMPLTDDITVNVKNGDYYSNGPLADSEFTISIANEELVKMDWTDSNDNPVPKEVAEKTFLYAFSDKAKTGDSVTLSNLADANLTLHIGANEDQETVFGIRDCCAESLGLNKIKIDTQEHANEAIQQISDAIDFVSEIRAGLGAMQNRLEHTINNLGVSSENTATAESQIRDVDMAEEMSNYTKESILVQAATAMLAQSNQQPQSVLSLIQGA